MTSRRALLAGLLVVAMTGCWFALRRRAGVPGPCDAVPDFAQLSFVEVARPPFRVFVLPGTEAARDLDALVAARRSALEHLTRTLQVDEPGPIELVFTPNRKAASAHDVFPGALRPGPVPRVEVLYLAAPHTYEVDHFGHELFHAVARRLDPGSDARHVALLDEGLAEVFDGSSRDLHQAYAQALRARGTSVDDAVEVSPEELVNADYGKAGSFAAALLAIDPSSEKLKASGPGCACAGKATRPCQTMACGSRATR